MSLIRKINLLLVNAVTLRREFKNLITRVAIFILLYFSIKEYGVSYSDIEIGIYNGLFHSTAILKDLDLYLYVLMTIAQALILYSRLEPPQG